MNCNLATPPTPHCRTAGRGGTVVAQNEMRPALLSQPDLVAHFNGKRPSDNEQRQDYGRRDPRARGESVSAPVRQGIPTVYRGVLMRSRTEARFAAFFDALGWSWDYEPFELNFYIPDFVLHFEHRPLLVEVKGATEDVEIAKWKIEQSGWDGEAIVVHRSPGRIWGPYFCVGDMWSPDGPGGIWGKGVMAQCLSCGRSFVYQDCGDWRCRRCGVGSEHEHLGDVDPSTLWADATNRVQWRPEA